MAFLRDLVSGRPWWMTGLLGFCLYMTFIYLPFDLFIKPVEEDQEVWFGITLTGWAAKATAPLHWLIYGFGAWGFFRMKAWMHPWAAAYVAQIAIGILVWSILDDRSLDRALIVATLFTLLAVALWNAREEFNGS